MDIEKMGKFISELRKSNQMTQKDLAAKLNISDKAVSKWERGLSCPDISLLSPIADIFSITTNELLNGERIGTEAVSVEVGVVNALKYADKAAGFKTQSFQNIFAIAFSIMLLLGIIVCSIVDLAISNSFTWSLIPISAIVFAWCSFFPVIKYGVKGITGSLIVLSALIIPYLIVQNSLIDAQILPIGIRMSVVAIVFMWTVFVVFKVLKSKKLIASAVSLLLAIPVSLLINLILSRITGEPMFDVWDAMSFSIIVVVAGVLLFIDYCKRNRA
ncbi:MAG: helix-turn-helix domain-containing protein [Defluviitaleaceae bacterium]|nr:helix-turn-helix domain-containing protein [Defluviitaleaceae bacterium]